METRARALERIQQYLKMRVEKPINGLDDVIHGVHTGTEWAGELRLSDLLLAVDHPPSGASPQAETSANVRALTVHICEDCLNLRGEMCNEPGCRFCRRTMAEVADYLDVLLIRPRIDGVSVLVDEGTPLPAPVSPVEPTTDLAIIEKCNARARQTASFLSNLEGIVRGGDFLLEAERQIAAAMMAAYVMARPASPVEPEPPTVECCACGHSNTPQQATRLEGEWRSSGEYVCLDSDACSRRIAKCSEPTVEPEPCVWREHPLGHVPVCYGGVTSSYRKDQTFCSYCGAPLKVER